MKAVQSYTLGPIFTPPTLATPTNKGTIQVPGLGGNVILRAAFQAPHRTVEPVGIDIAEQPDQVGRLVPALDVTVAAADKHKLPELMGVAELPLAAALASSTGVRHGTASLALTQPRHESRLDPRLHVADGPAGQDIMPL